MQLTTYRLKECATFRKTKDANGGLSNMAAGYLIRLGEIRVHTSEHLYQAMRFPDHPDIQRRIIDTASPIGAKMYAHTQEHLTRTDWLDVRVRLMEWCLRLKLLNNVETFGKLLVSVNDFREIVELSKKDSFWGAIPEGNDIAIGTNMLGNLLWVLGRHYRIGLRISPTSSVPNLRLFDQDANALAIAGLGMVNLAAMNTTANLTSKAAV